MMVKQPEKFFLPAIKNVPNSDLPALVYRNVLPRPFSSEQAKQLCEKNGWEKRVFVGANYHFVKFSNDIRRGNGAKSKSLTFIQTRMNATV